MTKKEEFCDAPDASCLDDTKLPCYGARKTQGGLVSQLSILFRRLPKPRCGACRKWNRVYLTGGSFLSHCVHCGAPLEMRQPVALWGVLVILGVGALALAAAIPLLHK
jgi:hypothetical protein